MWDILFNYYSLVIFLVLATCKGITEVIANRHCQREGGDQSSKFISIYFIVIGSLAPVMIFCEIFFLHHSLPLTLSLVLAAVQIALWFLRVITIRTLGEFYSVNIRVVNDHTLVKTGIYRYFRHPLYLIGIFENLFYPLASGAYISTLILMIFGTPPLLIRRRQEEKLLLDKFGAEYGEYRKSTWF